MAVAGALLIGLCNIIILLISRLLSVPWLALAESFIEGYCYYGEALEDAAFRAGHVELGLIIRSTKFWVFFFGCLILLMKLPALIRWLLGTIWAVISGVASIVWAVLTGLLYPLRFTLGFFYHLIFGR